MALDIYDITNKSDNTTYFYSSGIWNRPAGITMVNIIAIGAGGGGAGGCTRAVLVAGCGGGGGGSGGISKVTIPAILLPDSLKITIGLGGSGGTTSVSGGTGGNTYVDMPNSDGTLTYRVINANGGFGATPGGAAGSGGVAGNGATISSIGESAYAIFGITTFIPGQAGSSGGGTAGGTTLNFGAATVLTMITGGSGGGGINAANPGTAFAGGSQAQNANLYVPTITSNQGVSPNGINGQMQFQPFFYSRGGVGGITSNSTTGGYGGDGGIGAGGGGGGTGTSGTGGVGGAGGKGGDGLVIINCW